MSRYRNNEFVAFSELDGFGVIENRKSQAAQAIKSQADDYILNVNKVEYIEHLISEYSIQPLEIHSDQLSVSVEERMIPAEWHPSSFWVRIPRHPASDSTRRRPRIPRDSGRLFQ